VWDCDGGGKAITPYWLTPKLTMRGLRWFTDTKKRNEFRLFVRDNILGQIEDEIRDEYIKEKQKRVSRLLNMSKDKPSYAESYQKEKEDLDLMLSKKGIE